MTFQPSNMSYVQSNGSAPNNVTFPHIEPRDPTSTDINYPVGKRWTNDLEDKVWELTRFTSTAGVLLAHWEQLTGGGGGGPLTFNTDVASPANPIADELNVLGGNSTDNKILGIQTDGSGGLNTLTIQLTNRITGNTTTSDGDGQVQQLFAFPLGAVPGTYMFTTNLVAYNQTDSLSASYYINLTFRTTGVAATIIVPNDIFEKEESTMSNVVVTASNGGNAYTLSVTGIAGKTINWLCVTEYQFIS